MSRVHGEVMNAFSFHGLHTHCNLTLSVAIFLLIPRVTVIASSNVAVMSSLNKSKTTGI